jgi:hypothetical protein
MSKINFVYKTFPHLGSSLFGTKWLEDTFKKQGVLNYSYDVAGMEFLNVEELQKYPVFFMRGGMAGMGKIVDCCKEDQFKASFESESLYTRHGDIDAPGIKDRLKKFDAVFTCAESDLNSYPVETIFSPVWAHVC